MGFDLENFGLGLVAGWVTAYGVYRFRRVIGSAVEATRTGATSARSSVTRSADSRYINDLIELCERTHLAGRFARLTDVLVEPRFLPAPELAAPPEDEVVHDVFYVIPRVHDHPYLHAVYNLETLSIDDLATGSRALALLGLPGSGRTTALLTIALRSLGQAHFERPADKLQARLDAEEAALSEKERAARVKARITMQEKAKERLREQHGVTFDAEIDEAQRAAISVFNQLMPVYVHLANITVSPTEFGSEVDPAEPLVRAVQSQVGRITASNLPGNLYRRLNAGQVLLLLDGYDELPETERAEKLAWLKGFMSEYSSNFVIVTGLPQGYGTFTQLGFTPVYLRPWSDGDMRAAVNRWAEKWPQIGRVGRGAASPPEASLIERAHTNNRALSPTDLTLKIWSTYANDTDAAGFEGWLRAYIARHLPKDQAMGVILPQLVQMAAVQLDEGFITVARMEALAKQGVGDTSTEVNTLLDQMLAESEPEAINEKPKSKAQEKDKKSEEEASAQAKLIALLRRTGLLVSYRGGRYQFRHAFIAAYLASLSLKGAALAAKAEDPAWNQALAYATLHTSVEPVIRARMSATPDVLHRDVLEASRWLAYAGSKANWGPLLLKHLGNMLIAPNQYTLLRERAAAALVGTRDKNAITVFKQALRHPNADVRRLACLGLGALGDVDSVQDLVPLLSDKTVDVQLAAGMALGAINADAALEEITIALTEGSEQLRHAVAEAMAALPDEGHPILYDAISHEDMMVRRAAVFGLRRVRATWATLALYRAFLEDDQWYVRSAAQQAFQDLQNDQRRGPQPYPAVSDIPWLVTWAASHGEGVPAGEAGAAVLHKALQEGDVDVRIMAARVLGQIGDTSAARTLYATLRDRQENVRTAAHLALADLAVQVGEPLPAPV